MATRSEVGTPLGVLWVDPDERSLRRLAHHLAQPGGFLAIGTGDRFVQAARLDGGLVLEYRDGAHRRTEVADRSEVLTAFAEFWAGSTAFLSRYRWEPVAPANFSAPASPGHESVNELLAGAVNPRLIPLGFTANRGATRFRHRSASGEQVVQFSITRPRSAPRGTARIAARADIGLTEVDDQVTAWGVKLGERPRLTVFSDMCWPDAARWEWLPKPDDRFLKVSLEAFIDHIIVPLHTNVTPAGLVAVWDGLGLKHGGTRNGQVALAAALALAGDHERAVAVLRVTAKLQDDVGNVARALLARL